MQSSKRKICFILTSKIHYARNRLIIQELKKRADVELQLVVGASAILKQYADVEKWMEEDGLFPNARITMALEGGSPIAMAKTTGLGLIEFASAFENLKPDLVVVRGDRYEMLSAAIAAAYMNIPLAHLEGGDISGSIDESVRHAITKLAHIHFATNDDSLRRIIKMGENPKYVFNVGSPDVELAALSRATITSDEINEIGVGAKVCIEEPFLMVMQHPVTTEVGKNKQNTEETLKAICDLKIQTIWFWPNIDAGTDEVSNAIRTFRETTDINNYTRFLKHLPPEKFLALLKKSQCLIGNSSTGIKECSFLGIPVVNIGTREMGRIKAQNVIDVDYDSQKIKEAIKKQLKIGRYQPSNLYYKKDTSKKIAEILATCDLYIQKRFID